MKKSVKIDGEVYKKALELKKTATLNGDKKLIECMGIGDFVGYLVLRGISDVEKK